MPGSKGPLLVFSILTIMLLGGLVAAAHAQSGNPPVVGTTGTAITIQAAGFSTPISKTNGFVITYVLHGIINKTLNDGGTTILNTDIGTQVVIASETTGSSGAHRWVLNSEALPVTIAAGSDISIFYAEQFVLRFSGLPIAPQWYNKSASAAVAFPGVVRGADTGRRVSAYSVDGGALTLIQPTTGNVSFLLLIDAPHLVTVASVAQYKVSLDSGANASFVSITPPTIPKDGYWYDAGTPVSLVLNGIWGRSGSTGFRLSSVSVNGLSSSVASTSQIRAVSLASIQGPQSVTTSVTTQYQLGTSTGMLESVTPPSIRGDPGWYDSGTPVTAVYDYSWGSSSTGTRENALGYAVDGVNEVKIARAGTGTFSVQVGMGSSHGIDIVSVTQYGFTVSGGQGITLSSISPTRDTYFDSGSNVTITTDYTWNISNNDSRLNLISYTLDGALVNVTREDSGTFTAPAVTFNRPHALVLTAVSQYLIGFLFRDSTGDTVIIPTVFRVELGNHTTVSVPSFRLWLDTGSTYRIARIEWEGSDIKPTPATSYRVGGPLTQAIITRVYDAKFSATDYFGIPISGAVVKFMLPNGTTVSATTGGDGSVSLGLIPLGPVQATVSYLGVDTPVSGDASSEALVSGRILVSYPTFGFIFAICIIAALVGFLQVRASHRRARRAAMIAEQQTPPATSFQTETVAPPPPQEVVETPSMAAGSEVQVTEQPAETQIDDNIPAAEKGFHEDDWETAWRKDREDENAEDATPAAPDESRSQADARSDSSPDSNDSQQ